MNVLSGANDHDKLAELANKNYKDQAVWFLNAFWDELPGSKEGEVLYNHVQHIAELDSIEKKEGNSVDELQAHRFLEKLHETMTVQTMRDKLRSTGALGPNERPKMVPLVHYLIIRYNINWHTLVNAAQGSREEILKAQKMLDEVNEAFAAAHARATEAAAALKSAKAAEAEAKRSEAAAIQAENEAVKRDEQATQAAAIAQQREEELRAAQEELEASLNELKSQEDAYNNRTNELKAASESGGLVSRNKAKNELAQHLGAETLPLRRAKITQEAAVKKAERATAVAAEARASADAAKQEAVAAREEAENRREQAVRARKDAEGKARESERAQAEAEAALDEAKRKVEEAEAYLEVAKKSLPHGSTWWLERELVEAKKYLPKAKGGISK